MFRLCLSAALALLASNALAIVDMKNANYSHTWVDFRLPAVSSGVDLTLHRTYNSRTLFNGMFGFGWCTRYETSLKITAEGNLKWTDCGAGSEQVFVAASLTRADVEAKVDEIIGKLKSSATEYRDEQAWRDLRAELLEYDDLRAERAHELGLLTRPVDGGKYLLRSSEPHTVVESGNARQVTDEESGQVVFQDGIFRLTWSDGSRQYFDRRGKLLRWVDEAGHALELDYFDNGLLRRVADGKGRWLRFEYYPANSKVAKVVASDGTVAQYQYRNQDDLTYSIDAKRFATAYSYDDLHNVVKIVFTDGSRIRLRYDEDHDWVVEFLDRCNCQETYTYEIDAKDPKGHFWSTVSKDCDGQETARTRYEFWFKPNAVGEYVLDKIDVSPGAMHAAATCGKPFSSPDAPNSLPIDCAGKALEAEAAVGACPR